MRTSDSSRRFRARRTVSSRLVRTGGSLYFPCPRAGNRTQLCFALCRPVNGIGDCGRVAGHAQLGRTQIAILEHARRSIRV